MKERQENQYVKRTQKDYSYAFKLAVVEEVERGQIGIGAAQKKYGIQGDATIRNWIRKYGTVDWDNKSHQIMAKSPEQKLLELEQKVRLLEKQKTELEKKASMADKKAIFFDMMIDIAEEEFKIPIRKKYSPEQSNDLKSNKKKA
ncbi:transposase [Fulvivirga sediminis]|uniref:Transposase n=1 Tax=Fulvivirga sediminis TaxID=2803949 RepID=A0A937F8B8_9BACT|nr:transposase [Fulvivirga sediminis]MBL3658322.1 transposase [Fulvivirga sediminis]